jgi:autotransporter-associated beta strand protein
LNGSGFLDISQLLTSGTTAGSIEGAGNVFLGAKNLTVGGNNLSTTFSGVIQDGGSFGGTGGSLTKTGAGTLTLSGTNTYTGGTTISAGILQLGNGGTSGSIVGNVINNSIFAINRSDAFGFGGVISGSGAFQQNGTGTTTLTAANTYTGATTISAGTLAISGSGSITSNVTNNATFTNNGAVAGTVSNAATFNNNVGGTVSGLLTNNSGTTTNAGALNGGAVVNGGLLAVNGTAAAVTVNAGGTLGGNGIVGNTTINGGTLAPGNSIGTLTVQGSLVFTAASSYMVEVSPANADRTNVTGTATLGGATVRATFAPGTYVAKQYTIVNATGGVSGSFAGPVSTNLPANFSSSLSYDANNAFLNLTAALGAQQGLSGNQQNVANAINGFFNGGGTLPPGFVTLFGLTSGNLSSALSQASGETATGTQQTTFDAMNLFLGLLTDPFIAGRGDPVSAGSAAPQFAEENDSASAYAANGKARPKSERDAYAAVYRKAPVMAAPFAQRWSVWAAGYGGSQTTDGNATLGSNNITSRIAGGVAGADYRFSPFTLAGFALAGGGTSFSVANGLGSGRSDLFQAGAFVRHSVGPAYLSAALAYGWQDITTDRTVTIAGVDQLRAQFNANAWSGRVEGGYRFVTPWTGLTPYAAGQFTTFDLPAYAETAVSGANTFALAYGSKSVTASRSELGLRTDNSWAMQDGIFTVRGRFAWAHDFNTDRIVGATFQTLPGASFVVNGAAQAHDAALVTASAEKRWLNGWSAAATFEGEFSNVTRSYAGKGVVRYSW